MLSRTVALSNVCLSVCRCNKAINYNYGKIWYTGILTTVKNTIQSVEIFKV